MLFRGQDTRSHDFIGPIFAGRKHTSLQWGFCFLMLHRIFGV